MKQALVISGLLLLFSGCKGPESISNEVPATVVGYLIIDNWAKPCSGGGLQVRISSNHYTISNSVPSQYSDTKTLPVDVWIRYEPDVPDSCTQSTNRIKILSIRQR